MRKRIKCYIYVRVSTTMQVDGIDASKDAGKPLINREEADQKQFIRAFVERSGLYPEKPDLPITYAQEEAL